MPYPSLFPLPRSWPRYVLQGLLHAVGLERLALAAVRAGFENSSDPRSRFAAELDRLRELLVLREEEIRIKDKRLHALPSSQRPHYPPCERLAILLLRARAGWNAAETAKRFLLTPATIAAWMQRLDEQGSSALVQTREPVNRFPDFVSNLVRNLHIAAPASGRRSLAQILGRLGLRLAPSTVRRMRKKPSFIPPRPSHPAEQTIAREAWDPQIPLRRVTAKYPHHLWHIDLTTVPTGFGSWVPWWPFSISMRWIFSWHIALVADHFSRALLAFAVFKKEPSAEQICAFLKRAVRKAGSPPRHIVSDQGIQFRSKYRRWCRKYGAKPRFGSVGEHGSIAVIERCIRSLKDECLRRILIPFNRKAMEAEIEAYAAWYNNHRPHSTLNGATPNEMLAGLRPANQGLRFEPRHLYPLPRGDPKVLRVKGLILSASYVDGRKHLPVFELCAAA